LSASSTIPGSRRFLAASRPEDAGKALAERRGPHGERPLLRKDLGILRQVQLGEVNWIIKNPGTRKYHQFKNWQWQIIRLFDGRRTREQIREQIVRASGQDVKIELVLEYEEFLRRLELLHESVAERNLGLLDKFNAFRHQKAEEKAEGFNIFFIMFHVLDPDRFLNKTVKYVRWMWSKPMVLATIAASLWTFGVFVDNWDAIFKGTMDLYHFFGKPLLQVVQFFAILIVVGTIHEFAHAYATKVYGGECHDIGFALFYFTPAFYCDTSDTFMFKNRLHRLWVTIAGIYAEVAIASVATIVWVASYPDTILHEAAYKTMLFTGLSAVLFNINPLIKVDGYYALSSLLQIPDLRETAWKTVGAAFQKHILRLPVEIPPTTRRKRIIYWVYGIFSMMYTATIMYFIYTIFRNFYFRYFPDFGVVFLVLTLTYVFKKKVRTTRRVGKLFYLDKKEWLMSPRSRLPLAITAGVLLLVLGIPWSHRRITGTANLKPEEQARIQAPEDSRVAEVFVHEGDAVSAGQPLFRLTSLAVAADAEQHRAERERMLKKSSVGRASSNPLLAYQSERMAESEGVALKNAEARESFLIVRSPIAGRVLTPRPEDLVGRNVTAGTNLADVGDCRKLVAEVPVSERLLEYLRVGSPVVALIRTRPTHPWKGSVVSISNATLEQPVTSIGEDGPNVPPAMPDKFVVRAVFENQDGSLYPGAEARLKIRSRREAYLVRAWNVIWRWLRSVVWF
jgi:putative peptide zinc metalloprotease protein